jgi:hypothetical protein
LTRWTLGAWLGAGLAATMTTARAPHALAQASADPAHVVILTGGEASVPVPTLMEGPQASRATAASSRAWRGAGRAATR